MISQCLRKMLNVFSYTMAELKAGIKWVFVEIKEKHDIKGKSLWI